MPHSEAFGAGRLTGWQVGVDLEPPHENCVHDMIGLAAGDPKYTRLSPHRGQMDFGTIASFGIDFSGRTVTLVSAHPRADSATITHLLDDHVAPRVLARTEPLVLHASAVDIEGRLAILLGETGAGKSTLAAGLLARGYPLLGDDAAIISHSPDGFVGEAVYPSLRLFPSSIRNVFSEAVATRPMAFYSDKRLVLEGGLARRAGTQAPIAAGFVLARADHGVQVAAIQPAAACMMLIAHSFALDPADATAAAERLEQAALLASSVPFYALAYKRDFAILGTVCERVAAIVTDGKHRLPAASHHDRHASQARSG